MDNYLITQQIKRKIETLVLESILATVDRLTDQIIIMANAEKDKMYKEEKF